MESVSSAVCSLRCVTAQLLSTFIFRLPRHCPCINIAWWSMINQRLYLSPWVSNASSLLDQCVGTVVEVTSLPNVQPGTNNFSAYLGAVLLTCTAFQMTRDECSLNKVLWLSLYLYLLLTFLIMSLLASQRC